jgi:Phage integrase family
MRVLLAMLRVSESRVIAVRLTLTSCRRSERRASKRKATELKLNLPTFKECAGIYIRERWLTWSKKHRDQWPSSLKQGGRNASCGIIRRCPTPKTPPFMANLSPAGGIAASMLRFLIFAACRSNEVVEARWSEIDRPSSTWKIPGERMKMHQDHVVPLSEPALAILDEMRDGSQGDLIFPNPDDGMFSETRGKKDRLC